MPESFLSGSGQKIESCHFMGSDSESGGQNSGSGNEPARAAAGASGETNSPVTAAREVAMIPQQGAAQLDGYLESILAIAPVEPWPQAVNGAELLEEIRLKITGHVVLPRWAAETMALWVPHTFGFEYRDITTYLGIESPE